MSRYYHILLRTMGDLGSRTSAFRRTVYEQAQAALMTELAKKRPAPSPVDIDREHRALASAIRRIEAEAVIATGEMSAAKLSISKEVVLSALAKGKAAAPPRTFPSIDMSLLELLPN
jgi:hypothetical protein